MSQFGAQLVAQYAQGPAEFQARGAQIGLALLAHQEQRRQFDAELSRQLHNDQFQQRNAEQHMQLQQARFQLDRQQQAIEAAAKQLEQDQAVAMSGALKAMVDQQRGMQMVGVQGVAHAPGGVAVPVPQMAAAADDPTLNVISDLADKVRSPHGFQYLAQLAREPMERRAAKIESMKWLAGQGAALDAIKDAGQREAVKAMAEASGPGAASNELFKIMDQQAKAAQAAAAAQTLGIDPTTGAALNVAGAGVRQEYERRQKEAGRLNPATFEQDVQDVMRLHPKATRESAEAFVRSRARGYSNQEPANMSGRSDRLRVSIENDPDVIVAKAELDAAKADVNPLFPDANRPDVAKAARAYADAVRRAAGAAPTGQGGSHDEGPTADGITDEQIRQMDATLTKQLGRRPTDEELERALQTPR